MNLVRIQVQDLGRFISIRLVAGRRRRRRRLRRTGIRTIRKRGLVMMRLNVFVQAVRRIKCTAAVITVIRRAIGGISVSHE